MNFVWVKYLNSGSGVKQRRQLVGDDGAGTDAAEQSGSIEKEGKMMRSSTVMGEKSRDAGKYREVHFSHPAAVERQSRRARKGEGKV